MKIFTYIFIIATFTLAANLKAQVAIGKDTPANFSVLDFGTDGNKGIVLPYVTDLDAATVPGTIYFDANTSKVKFRLANDLDQDLSIEPMMVTSQFNPASADYASLTEEATLNGAVFGAEASTVPGVLVLESDDSALVLPHAVTYANVGDPAPGTIVYDSTKKLLCVFDGEKWAFWGYAK